MELYLDTADLAVISRLSRILPLAGVTTNPSIVAASGRPLHELLIALRDLLGPSATLFAQVMATEASQMVKEAELLRSVEANLVVKVPVNKEGLVALKELRQRGIPTLGTAVYSPLQGLLSALAGADYVAPYVNRIDAQGGDGIKAVIELQQLLELHAPHAKVLAASFKNPRQALDCLLAGTQAITLPADVAEQILTSPAVDSAIERFVSDWHQTYGTSSLLS